MCLIIFAFDCHPDYKLVVAANRDEYYNRPDLPAAYWSDNPDILAGKDLQQGGTWMGVTTTGRFAALTNYRDPSSFKPEAPSRGHLVQNFLSSNVDAESYITQLTNKGVEYNGFNLLLGTFDSLYYYSNREMTIRLIDKGIHGLSNSLLDIPWPKVTKGINCMADCLQQKHIATDDLFAMMADREQPADQDLPQTGVGLQMERMLGPAYIVSPVYGTKSTTVLLVDYNNKVRFWERTFPTKQPSQYNEVYYEFVVK